MRPSIDRRALLRGTGTVAAVTAAAIIPPVMAQAEGKVPRLRDNEALFAWDGKVVVVNTAAAVQPGDDVMVLCLNASLLLTTATEDWDDHDRRPLVTSPSGRKVPAIIVGKVVGRYTGILPAGAGA